MKPYELFNYIKSINHNEYFTSGDSVQWTARAFDGEKIVRFYD